MTRPAAARAARWREPLVVTAAGALLAVVLNWNLVGRMSTHVAGDLGDPLYWTWALAWIGQSVSAGELWNANIFYPASDSLAFTDSLLGYLPLTIGNDDLASALTRYNLCYLASFGLAFGGGYALARQLGSSWPAAAFAGVALTVAPWRFAHIGHLNILSIGGIALALAALARGYGYSFRGGYQVARVRPGWIIAGWALAAWQVTIGFAIGLPFCYVLIVLFVAAVVGWWARGRPAVPQPMLLATVGGVAGFLAVTYLMAIPYLRVADRYGVERSQQEVELYSPPWFGLFTAPAQNRVWGDAHQHVRAELGWAPEMALLPGFVLLSIGIAGLFVSAWPRRIRLTLGIVASGFAVLSLGTSFFGGIVSYLPLWEFLPGFNALRTSGRLILWTTLCLALLAAGAIDALGARLRRVGDGRAIRRRVLAAVCVVPAVLALLEGLPRVDVLRVPTPPPALAAALADTAAGPALVLPTGFPHDFRTIAWTARGLAPIANGSSSFTPPSYDRIVTAARELPNAKAVETLRHYGIARVLILRSAVVNTPFAAILQRPVAVAGVQRVDQDDLVILELR